MRAQITDEQIAGLREEIRDAGAATDRVRCALWCASMVPSFGVIISGGMIGLAAGAGLPNLLLGTLVGCCAALLFGAAASVPISWAYRRLRGAQVRRTLRRLPRQYRAAVLLPLRHDLKPDTRKIATTLLRHVPVPAEVAPALALPGRGDEPAS